MKRPIRFALSIPVASLGAALIWLAYATEQLAYALADVADMIAGSR